MIDLRDATEPGFDPEEKEAVEGLGIEYHNAPTKMGEKPSDEVLEIVANQVKLAAKPTLLHCRRGVRSAFVVRYLSSTIAPTNAADWPGVEQLTPELFMAGQIQEADAEKAKEFGIKTIVNLRTVAELTEAEHAAEKKWCDDRNITYLHFPVAGSDLKNTEFLDKLVATLTNVQRPALVHCRSAMRATVASLCMLHTGVLKEIAPEIPLTMRDLVQSYIEQRKNTVRINDHIIDFDENTLITGQLSVAQMQQLPAMGIKSVLNLRSPSEEGFVQEEEKLIKGLGLIYMNIPTSLERIPTDEENRQIHEALEKLPKKVLIHCRRGLRSAHVLEPS